jgi:hypothetical protein
MFYNFLDIFHSLNGAFFIEIAPFPSLNSIKKWLNIFLEETLTNFQYDCEAYETLKNNMRNATQLDGWRLCSRRFY